MQLRDERPGDAAARYAGGSGPRGVQNQRIRSPCPDFGTEAALARQAATPRLTPNCSPREADPHLLTIPPFEMTAPNLLKTKGHQSALFGKFHLGLQENNPFRYAMPRSLGWD